MKGSGSFAFTPDTGEVEAMNEGLGNLSISADLAIDPSDASRIYVAAGKRVSVSQRRWRKTLGRDQSGHKTSGANERTMDKFS